MRFMMLMIPGGYARRPDAMPSAEAVKAMMKYSEELKKAGVLLRLHRRRPARGSAFRVESRPSSMVPSPMSRKCWAAIGCSTCAPARRPSNGPGVAPRRKATSSKSAASMR